MKFKKIVVKSADVKNINATPERLWPHRNSSRNVLLLHHRCTLLSYFLQLLLLHIPILEASHLKNYMDYQNRQINQKVEASTQEINGVLCFIFLQSVASVLILRQTTRLKLKRTFELEIISNLI